MSSQRVQGGITERICHLLSVLELENAVMLLQVSIRRTKEDLRIVAGIDREIDVGRLLGHDGNGVALQRRLVLVRHVDEDVKLGARFFRVGAVRCLVRPVVVLRADAERRAGVEDDVHRDSSAVGLVRAVDARTEVVQIPLLLLLLTIHESQRALFGRHRLALVFLVSTKPTVDVRLSLPFDGNAHFVSGRVEPHAPASICEWFAVRTGARFCLVLLVAPLEFLVRAISENQNVDCLTADLDCALFGPAEDTTEKRTDRHVENCVLAVSVRVSSNRELETIPIS